MITKHFRLSINFHVSIADVPPLLPLSTIDPPEPEYDGRQARLLEAVKKNPRVLACWVHDLIATHMYVQASHYW